MPLPLPLPEKQALRATQWLRENFGPKIEAATAGTAFAPRHIAAIVCQETAFVWIGWLKKMTAVEIIARCVFDASGDASGTNRSAFPTNTAAFRAKYGDAFTKMLIDEANATRALRGYSPQTWVYKGYGLFRYDLQKVVADEAYFRDRQWADFDICLAKCMAELKEKHKAKGELWAAIKAYNGSSPRAEDYKERVKAFTAICAKPWP